MGHIVRDEEKYQNFTEMAVAQILNLPNPADRIQLSIAISLMRIADVLETFTDAKKLAASMHEMGKDRE